MPVVNNTEVLSTRSRLVSGKVQYKT